MKKIFLISFFIFLLCGCSSQKTWVYTPNQYDLKPIEDIKKAVVLPFADKRTNQNKNRIALYLIPLIPFGWMEYEAPEGSGEHVASGLWTNYKPTEDYPKALAEELRSAKVFGESYFSFKKGEADFIIQGEILSTKYEGAVYTYGLSVVGPLLWLIGFPAGSSENELSINLTCLDAKTDQQIFSRQYTAPPYKKISWIYWLKSDFNYAEMLKGVYEEFIHDLRVALK